MPICAQLRHAEAQREKTMPSSNTNIGWVLILLGLVLMPFLPMVVKFHWLEPKGGNRWAR
jgi:hypothetical protein